MYLDMYISLRIQNLPDRRGLKAPIPSEKNRRVWVFLGHTWILRVYNMIYLYILYTHTSKSGEATLFGFRFTWPFLIGILDQKSSCIFRMPWGISWT